MDPKDNPLSVSWHDSNWIPMLNPANIMDYFSERSNPFYDRNCNNEIVKMQRLNPDQLVNMTGTEYILLHVQEPILYVIRKQHRHSPAQATPMADYYIIAGVVYQAPDLGSVFSSRVLSAVHNLQGAFDEALSYSRYHPSKGYSWDFKDKNQKAAMTVSTAKKSSEREETSSLFQRQRVDMLLRELTNKYPPKVIQPVPVATAEQAKSTPADEIKTEPRSEKTDTPLPQGRMRPPPEKKPRLN
ncbi:mediator of RNA polymerase II transcription subunit 6 [Neocloeon triangulifer]|uniref:mediator of RNA polymerase II transcription subunit 6 n=1 Tax=Neocloeon triangulifer TaxID=2078957 RepID=UPI00286F9E85|nr:mediator of RNA polymerase II transcription subunit 6 [Neocloeon triangulifer]